MCGIFGYVGRSTAYGTVKSGLKALEYRGYDSCGICLHDSGLLNVTRVVGSTDHLPNNDSTSTVAIGHTRWATHGEVSVKNAHPHLSNCSTVAIVHNGVIENCDIIKARLAGFKQNSDTDSEVLANLIAAHYIGDIEKAVENSLKEVRGSYGVAVLHKDHPNTIICAKKGSPICIGIGKDEICIASDTSAIPLTIDKVVYLDDNQLAVITGTDFKVKSSNKIVNPEVNELKTRASDNSHEGYTCFLEKEIYEQSVAIENTMRGRFSKDGTYVKFGGIEIPKKVNRVIFLGCGTAYHAGIVGKYYMENIANIPVTVEYSSEFKYKNNPINSNTLVVAISQSGETADTLTAIDEAINRDAMVLSITNTVASTIARTTKNGIYQYAGPEMSVASTKAYTSQICILAMLAIMLGRKNGLSQLQASRLIKKLKSLPELVTETIKMTNNKMKALASVHQKIKSAVLLGKQYMYPTAIEGALKLKELTYIETHGYPAGEIKHGPLAAIGHNSLCFFLAPQEDMYEKNISNIQEIKARDAQVTVISQEGLEFSKKICANVIYIPKSHDILHPILAVIPLQLFSMYLAQKKHLDVDRPRHLAKSVTVE